MKNIQSDTYKLLSSWKKPAKIFQAYNQRDTNWCIFFAFAGMLAWNTGVVLTDEQVAKLAQLIKPWKLEPKMAQIAKQLESTFTMYRIPQKDWRQVMKWGWSIQMSLFPPDSFFIDAVKDGDIDDRHPINLDQNHSVYGHEDTERIVLENSWTRNDDQKQTWDITDDLENLQEDMIRGFWYVFVKK